MLDKIEKEDIPFFYASWWMDIDYVHDLKAENYGDVYEGLFVDGEKVEQETIF